MSEPGEMIFRKTLDQTGTWLMAELPAWAIFHGVRRGCRKKKEKKKKKAQTWSTEAS